MLPSSNNSDCYHNNKTDNRAKFDDDNTNR